MSKKSTPSHLALAACAFALTAGAEIQLLPAGEFRAIDGRPKDTPAWRIDAELAAALIADVDARANPLVLDYEHQTLLAADNGQPAPAAGWFKRLEWHEDGLWAVDVEWTERARAMIEAGEYLYISPVFSYDRKTGAVLKLINAALTNNPALDGMDAVAARFLTPEPPHEESLTMDIDELLNQLRWMLNLPALATAEEITADLQKAIDAIKSGNAEAAAANFNLIGFLAGKDGEIAALKSAAPDPAKYVPVETVSAVQAELDALKAFATEREVGDVVAAALSSGKLLPAQKDWAVSLGKENMAALTGFLETAQPVAALAGTQTGGVAPTGKVDATDPTALAVAAQEYQGSEARAGRNITIAAAVQHVAAQSK